MERPNAVTSAGPSLREDQQGIAAFENALRHLPGGAYGAYAHAVYEAHPDRAQNGTEADDLPVQVVGQEAAAELAEVGEGVGPAQMVGHDEAPRLRRTPFVTDADIRGVDQNVAEAPRHGRANPVEGLNGQNGPHRQGEDAPRREDGGEVEETKESP